MKIIIEQRGITEIDIFETDSIKEMESRIIEGVNKEYPDFVLFKERWKIPIPKEIQVWDMETIFDSRDAQGNDILRNIDSLYESYIMIKDLIELNEYLEYFCFWLWKEKFKKKWIAYSMTVNSILTKSFISKFGKMNETDWNMSQFIQRRLLNEDHLHVMEDTMKERIVEMRRKNKKSMDIGRRWEEMSIEGFQETKIEEIGKVMTIFLETEQYCTATLFQKIRLSSDYPIAFYQEYVQYYYPEGVEWIKTIQRNEWKKEGLSIYDKNGEMNIYVENTERGILAQFVSLSREISSIDKVFEIIGIQKEEVRIEQERMEGVLAEWTIQTPRPVSMKAKEKWSGIEPYIFANLCLNEHPFCQFLWTNDTDKISRTSWTLTRRHEALYLYFFVPEMMRTGEEEGETAGIQYLETWNRSKSRFGQLSCIATPLETADGEYVLNLRITRSVSREVVSIFRIVFLKLIRFYYKEYSYQWNQVFKKWLPELEPTELIRMEKNIRVQNLPTHLDPDIFVPHIYLRSCQNPKVIPITEGEAREEKEKDKILQFPPRAMKGYKPKFYRCPEEPSKRDGKQYLYPGLVKMNTKDHPFGYAPCCYIENHREQNRKIEKKLLGLEETDEEKRIKTTPLSFQYILKSDKLLRRLGGIGMLPEDVQTFLYQMDIEMDYYRVGGVSSWSSFSILSGLEYWYAWRKDEPYLRNAQELKETIVQSVSSIKDMGSTELFDWTLEKSTEEFLHGYMDPKRFLSVLEEYYQVRIVILTRNEEGKLSFLQPFYYQSFFIKSFRSDIPILCFYQHFGGTTESIKNRDEPVCELIVAIKNKVPVFDFLRKEVVHDLYKESVHCYAGTTRLALYQEERIGEMDGEIVEQYVDIGGKTIFVEYSNHEIGILTRPRLPLRGIKMSSRFPSDKSMVSRSTRQWEERTGQEMIEIESLPILMVRESDQYFLFSLEEVEIRKRRESVAPELIKTVSFLSCPSLVRIAIYSSFLTSSFSYMDYLNGQSHALMLQDHVTYRFSYYLEENKRNWKMYGSQMTEWVNVFMEECIEFTLDSERYMETPLYPMFVSEIDRKRKIRLPRTSEKNIFFFLTWLLKNSPNLEFVYKMREVPSFLNHIQQFVRRKDQIVQKCGDAYYYPYLYRHEMMTGPIETLQLKVGQLYYYQNQEMTLEFFHLPHIVFRSLSFIKGIETWMSYSNRKTTSRILYFFDIKKEKLAGFLSQEKEIVDIGTERHRPLFYLYAISKNDFLFFVSI